jgi:hypothetical protein
MKNSDVVLPAVMVIASLSSFWLAGFAGLDYVIGICFHFCHDHAHVYAKAISIENKSFRYKRNNWSTTRQSGYLNDHRLVLAELLQLVVVSSLIALSCPPSRHPFRY